MRRALVVGAGPMGRAWMRTIVECDSAQPVGVVDVNTEALERAQSELAGLGLWTGNSLEQGIRELAPDFVLDATSPESHCEVTLAALRSGLPVLGEKPMAASMREAALMVSASQEAGRLYMVSQSRRYDGRLEAYSELIQGLGDLAILTADFFIGPHFGGFREEMRHVLLLDMAIHTFDQARYLCGADAAAVFCEEFNPGHSWFEHDACAFASFEMTNGAKFHYRGSWCAEGLPTSWESQWRAVGSRGTAIWNGEDGLHQEVVAGQGGFVAEVSRSEAQPAPRPHSGIAGSLREFLAALEDPALKPWGRCEDNIKSLAMVFGAIQSAKEGRRVEIEV